MCSRFDLNATRDDVCRRFGLKDVPEAWVGGERRPTDPLLVIEGRHGALRTWGIPSPKDGKPLINARSETLSERPTFRRLLERRCLIPADGYWEWPRVDGRAVKTRIARPDNALVAFAGLTDGACVAVITCAPAPGIAQVHDRMPVILAENSEAAWTDPRRPFSMLATLLAPYDGPLRIAPVTPPLPRQPDLFGP